MKTLILITALLFGIAAPARADFVDMFNGVSLGSQLPENDLQFMSSVPDPGAKLLLIDFWATWCEPCRESIPKLNSLRAEFAPKGLEIVGVTKEQREVVASFLTKVSMLYPHAIEGAKSLHNALGIRALPYAIFVDKSGKIIWRGQPSAVTADLISTLLAKQNGG